MSGTGCFHSIRIESLRNGLKRLEIELYMTTGFFNRLYLKNEIKRYAKQIARHEKEKMIDDILEEELK